MMCRSAPPPRTYNIIWRAHWLERWTVCLLVSGSNPLEVVFFIHLFIYSTTDLDFRATQIKLDTESVLERKVGQQGPNTITFLFRTDYTHMDS